MDSLQRFSIERLTSPNLVPSSKTHTGWNALPSPSSVYQLPSYRHTPPTIVDKIHGWDSGQSRPGYGEAKHNKMEDVTAVKKTDYSSDVSYDASSQHRQYMGELKSPIISTVSQDSRASYGKSYHSQKQQRQEDVKSKGEIENGCHRISTSGKGVFTREETEEVDVTDDLQPESKERTSSESQEEEDPNGKPEHSYIALISMSILASIEKKLVLSDIYQYIMDNFQYYNNQERAWRNSIRHNLSLNECFIKAGRAENGKGNYWAIHPACFDDFAKGDYRRRHARRRARGGPYSDINVSSLPYNYRCNLGYVPMSPSSAIGYPYPFSYIHSLSNPATATSLLRGTSDITNSNNPTTAITSATHPTIPPTASTKVAERNHAPRFSAKDNPAQDFKNLSSLSSPVALSSSKTANLLPQAYLPNMLSPSLRYSPYGFPFF